MTLPFRYWVCFQKFCFLKWGCSDKMNYCIYTHTIFAHISIPRSETADSEIIHIFEALDTWWKLLPRKIHSTFNTIHLSAHYVPGSAILKQMAEWLWGSDLMSLIFNFLIYKMRVMPSMVWLLWKWRWNVYKVPIGAQWIFVSPPP